jgi:DNA-binding MarR family transcriptional regulator
MSAFNLKEQENKIESKIVVALERIAEAFRVLLWHESKKNALSPIQIQILIFLLFHHQEKCKVSYLAQEFNMTKATISDSVRVLLKKQLILKESDAADARSFTISLTTAGEKIAQKASQFATAIEKPLARFSKVEKQHLFNSLLQVIQTLNNNDIITVQRMCKTCANYRFENGTHYCRLLNLNLKDSELRVDCAEHEAIY